MRFSGDVLLPDESAGLLPDACIPPPGHVPDEDGPGFFWNLPIRGVPRLEDGVLVITHDDVEYVYEPATEAEYLADFGRRTVAAVDPVEYLASREVATWDERYFPTVRDAVTTTTVP